MKKRYLLLIAFASCSVVLAGGIWPWDTAKPAPITLHVAYNRALVALGTLTNEFHCLSARVSTELSNNGEWEFVFYSTNTNTPPKPKKVYVEFNGHTQIDPDIFR